MGRERRAPADHRGLGGWRGTPGRFMGGSAGGHGDVLRGSRGDAAGTKPGSSFAERIAVNTGTVPVCPTARGQRAGLGWARCRPAGLGRGGAAV